MLNSRINKIKELLNDNEAALISSVVINISILGFFKYADFIIKNISRAFLEF